jgi:hypothetical protein
VINRILGLTLRGADSPDLAPLTDDAPEMAPLTDIDAPDLAPPVDADDSPCRRISLIAIGGKHYMAQVLTAKEWRKLPQARRDELVRQSHFLMGPGIWGMLLLQPIPASQVDAMKADVEKSFYWEG